MKTRKMIKTCGLWALVCGLMFSAALSCRGQEGAQVPLQELSARGNEYYENGDYASAIGEYEKILATGRESGRLYYNLANAYFKAGNLGKAILNYQRAKDLLPRDADLKANYRYARAMVQGKEVPCRGIWNWTPIRLYCSNFTVDEMTAMASGMYLAIILMLFIGVLRPGTRRFSVPVSVMLVLLIILNVAVIWHKSREIATGAVTIAPKTEALFGPYDSATKFFTLPEGMRVNVLGKKDEWLKVRRSDGNVGWVRGNDIEMIR